VTSRRHLPPSLSLGGQSGRDLNWIHPSPQLISTRSSLSDFAPTKRTHWGSSMTQHCTIMGLNCLSSPLSFELGVMATSARPCTTTAPRFNTFSLTPVVSKWTCRSPSSLNLSSIFRLITQRSDITLVSSLCSRCAATQRSVRVATNMVYTRISHRFRHMHCLKNLATGRRPLLPFFPFSIGVRPASGPIKQSRLIIALHRLALLNRIDTGGLTSKASCRRSRLHLLVATADGSTQCHRPRWASSTDSARPSRPLLRASRIDAMPSLSLCETSSSCRPQPTVGTSSLSSARLRSA